MFCSKCGAKVDEQWKFCKSCGSSVIVTSDQIPQKEPLSELNQESSKQTMEWYYLAGSDKLGPISDNEISEMIQRGDIKKNTLVWSTGLTDWVPAEQSPLSSKFENVVSFAPASKITDLWFWALAVIPTLSVSLLTFFGLFKRHPFLPLVYNIFFLYEDIKVLKKAGQVVGAWKYWGVIMPPVYLYIRASKTNKQYAPLIVWFLLGLIDVMFLNP